ncbi:hypothetical protein PAHAL_7G154000 [Panicum hallii]|uniref:Uncharacterized protein n=1 Tax=Panicum hallii TaxID=206008 RepID=A0A2T8ICC2_9POAL|nr:hypothetical protein PAHAL_7G154000 [Panicum hallii]
MLEQASLAECSCLCKWYGRGLFPLFHHDKDRHPKKLMNYLACEFTYLLETFDPSFVKQILFYIRCK